MAPLDVVAAVVGVEGAGVTVRVRVLVAGTEVTVFVGVGVRDGVAVYVDGTAV